MKLITKRTRLNVIKPNKTKLSTEEELKLSFGVTNMSPFLPSHASRKFSQQHCRHVVTTCDSIMM